MGGMMVVQQEWIESERGWGKRPDGVSLHMTSADCKQYIKEYWAGMPEHAPSVYERPYGEPEIVKVSEAWYELVVKSGTGIRLYSKSLLASPPPPLTEER